MKKLLITFILGAVMSLTSFGQQDKVLYDDADVTIQTSRLDCGGFLYANFTFTNKTNSNITLTYVLEAKYPGELTYVSDTDHGPYTVTISPNGTVSGACGDTNYLFFLGKREHQISVLDYKVSNVVAN